MLCGNGQPDVSKLYKLNLRSGDVSVILDAKGGSIRDLHVHYEGKKILFSYRKADTDFYHLYEINVDGSGLRQITHGKYDDIEPIYMPDDRIAFVSTRCNRWVNCWTTQVAIIYRCNPDGSDIQMISPNPEHDNTPWMLPDGRILYTRWEYVDRSQVEYHHLWTMNPDGTGQSVFYGNMHSYTVMIDAKPIPGSDKILACFSPGHGVNEHAGIATVVSPDGGPDAKAMAVPMHKGRLVRDPFPFSETCVIAAQDNAIVLINGSGQTEVIYKHGEPGLVHEPRPVMSRPREILLQPRVKQTDSKGYMVLADINAGRNLPGIKHGEVKKLLILEVLPKPVNFSGGPDLTSWLGTFTLERILGTVPVEEDGSAYFEVPADRSFFFVALDKDDLSVKRMQSWCSVRPGEVLSCVGCHEHRTQTPNSSQKTGLAALKRNPSRISSYAGYPDVMDYTRDIQPILDRHCVRCHGYEKREGKVILAGDLGPHWSHSYFQLLAYRQVADGRNGLGNQPPRTLGSSASPLLKKINGGHYDVEVDEREWRTLWLWIESGAAYAGSYAGLRNEETQKTAYTASSQVFVEQFNTLKRRCGDCHLTGGGHFKPELAMPVNYEDRWKQRASLGRPAGEYERIVFEKDPIALFSPNILFNFTRPWLSPILLGPLAKSAGGFGSCGEIFKNREDPDYQSVLAAINRARTLLDSQPRFGHPQFKANSQYVRELKKYGVLPSTFDLQRDTLDVFASDQQYWRSLWP